MKPLLSVIIPTRNRANLLEDVLVSLKEQSLSRDRFEVLVIDNGSVDNTRSVVKSFNTNFNVRYIFEAEPGLHSGRHCGLKNAGADILVYVDDDIEAFSTYLESILEAFQDPEVALVGGNNVPKFLQSPPLWLKKLWDSSKNEDGKCFPPLSILELNKVIVDFNPSFVWGCNFSVRKQTLVESGGFHPDGMPQSLIKFRGDGESHVTRFIKNSGKKCLFHPGASVYHKVSSERMTFEYFRKRGFNQGISDSYTLLREGRQSFVEKARATVRPAINALRHLIRIFKSKEKGVATALKELDRGYYEGYSFHQKEFARDPVLREWVSRANYFDGGINDREH